MYSRRSSSGRGSRFVVGIVAVALAIGGFAAFQALTTRSPDSALAPTPTSSLAARGTLTPASTGKPVTYRIISDKANLSTQITSLYYALNTDNWDLSFLGGLAGHLQGTPNFGAGGNYVLAGHVELKDGGIGPFANIHLLKVGDGITIIGDQAPNPAVMQYTVTDVKKVQPQDFGVMRNHGYEELTLITCDDWDQKTASYGSRIIVHARPSSTLQRQTVTAIASQTRGANGSPLNSTATPRPNLTTTRPPSTLPPIPTRALGSPVATKLVPTATATATVKK